ncbi:MAG: GNAT family N-acetyltransferase [Pyrinomonadaceae bacterium]|nr:GNAT family N-acetyltransferase [Pyrinomonadaceae bacterium]MCX7638837.1 GNAT family N-acetyltransferase [Pyrinomonadaceae bacterium]MDW8305027.1 GNAT family N-acetyltransferase [Acidobacteriota bacterium]
MLQNQPITIETKKKLKSLSRLMSHFHKILLDDAKEEYEKANGNIPNVYLYFQLVLEDKHFAWLRKISYLIALIDEATSVRHPATEEEARKLLKKTHSVLSLLDESDEFFNQKLQKALSKNKAASLIHNEILSLLRMKSQLKITRANERDAEALAKLAKQTFYEAFANDPRNSPEDMKAYTDKAFSVEQISKELCDESIFYFLAKIDEELIGYAKLKPLSQIDCVSAERPIELCRLYLLQKYIGKGFGRSLMNHCLSLAREMKHDVMWLGVWEYNYRAQKFYEKFGFERAGEHIFQLGNDPQTDWIMQKRL